MRITRPRLDAVRVRGRRSMSLSRSVGQTLYMHHLQPRLGMHYSVIV